MTPNEQFIWMLALIVVYGLACYNFGWIKSRRDSLTEFIEKLDAIKTGEPNDT